MRVIFHLPHRRMATGLTATAMVGVLLGPVAMASGGPAAASQRAAQPWAGLSSVSCLSTVNCVAVGWRELAGGAVGSLVWKWNGTKWSVVPSPPGAMFNGVTCTSAANCLAVGSSTNAGAPPLAAARWNGTKWSPVSVPSPPHYKYAYLSGITCTSATNCWAVGAAGSPLTSKVFRTLIEHWNGVAWSLVPSSPVVASSATWLSSVACASSRECWAVGFWYSPSIGGSSLTERWNGSAWSVVGTPSDKNGALAGDYCSSASACWAVGGIDHSSCQPSCSLPAITQRWNGTKWVSVPPAQPRSTSAAQFAAVACASESACEGTGNWYYTLRKSIPLGEGWNGRKWTLQKMPTIPIRGYADLTGISCPTSTDCWAAGEAANSLRYIPLLEHWNGKTWSLTRS